MLDTQVLQKKQIDEEILKENLRLNALMEEDRVNAICIDESIEKKRYTERLLGAKAIMKQIQENEVVTYDCG